MERYYREWWAEEILGRDTSTKSTGKASTAPTPLRLLTWVWPMISTSHDFSLPATVPAASPDRKEILFTDDLHVIESGEADVRSTVDPTMFAPPVLVDPQSLGSDYKTI